MKVIRGQKILSVSSTSEDTNYPDDNILDEHPKKLWKAANGVYEATLTFQVTNNTDGMAIFNTNALGLNVTVSDPNEIVWHAPDVVWDSGDISWPTSDSTVTDLVLELDGESGAAWIEWPLSPSPSEVYVTFTAGSTETVFAGVAVACIVTEYSCPQLGVTESMKSYSIIRELQNGAFYRKERDKVRTFSFNIIEDRGLESADFYSFMYRTARTLGYRPCAWKLTDMNGFWWVIYARFERMPVGKHTMPNHSIIQSRLIEVL